MQTAENLPEITVYPAGQRTGGFICRECRLIREVPGTRRIFSALWQDQPVIVKVFSRRFSAYRHVMREWNALQKLRNLQILRPEPLFYGKTDKGDWALAAEYIPHAADVFTLFQTSADRSKRENLLLSVISQLAHLHIHGILQKDMHLGNFLWADNRIYILDPAQIKFYDQPVTVKKGFAQLAMLCVNWPADDEPQMEVFIRKYFAVRGLTTRPWLTESILRMIRTQRNRILARSLKKTLRTSKRYLALKTAAFRGMFVKDLFGSRHAAELPSQIDLWMNRGKILKRGNTCFVVSMELNDKTVVVKRYNHKGLWHSLRQTIRSSRARRCWLHGHRLNWLNIPTAAPLAFIEKRRGLLLYCSYIINEFVEGQKLDNYMKDVSIPEEQQIQMMGQVEQILQQMELYRITHGDLKRANIIITNHGPVLIDLDSLKVHRLGFLFGYYRRKDIARITDSLGG